MKPHFNIIIATPGRNMEAEYVKSLVKTINYLNDNDISYYYTSEYSSQVSMARESTIMSSKVLSVFSKEPLHGAATYDKIIWIDSDISWEIEDFINLYKSNLDIVSGIYINEDEVPLFLYKEDDIYFKDESWKNKKYPFKVFGVGFGFVAMKNGIFENIPRPWFNTVFQEIENEDKTEKFYLPWGEDLSWCKKANEQGYDLYVDPSIRVTHHKKMSLK